MLTSPVSLTIMFISACLILVAVFSKQLKLKHRKQVEVLKKYDDSLSEKDRKERARLQYATIMLIEVVLVLLIVFCFALIEK